MQNFLVLDIENDSSNKWGRKAGHFLVDQIVAVGFKTRTEHGAYYFKDSDFNQYANLFCSNYNILVGHNIKHDLLFFWHLDCLQTWLKAGGKIWDTQLAEYILTGQQNKYAKLRDIAVNKYKCPIRSKHIDDLLFNKIEPNDYTQVSELPRELVLEDVKNDVLDTEKIYLEQLKEAEQLGMTKLIEAHMDVLLLTCECEHNGMQIDFNKLSENTHELMNELTIEYNQLQDLIKDYWR